MKIAVGLSGGIDSTVALLRLHEKGHDLIGITMKATFGEQDYGKCCSIKDVHDAKYICQTLGIRHYVIDVKKEFYEKIVKYFVDEYINGHTPNPCIFCNELIKFKRLIEAANSLGYDYFATGHYAIIDKYVMKKGIDKLKDQTYFLSRLPLSILKKSLFPLGKTYKKDNINYLSEKSIYISKKRESHEICFVLGNDYRELIKQEANDKIKTGDILDEAGYKIGEHKGIAYYTIGQRKGLNIAMAKPIYVRELKSVSNSIVVGEKPYNSSFIINNVNWLLDYDFDKPLTVKVRYFHEGEEAILKKSNIDGEFVVQLRQSVFAITKGQAAVFYDNDIVVCSGIIKQIIDDPRHQQI